MLIHLFSPSSPPLLEKRAVFSLSFSCLVSRNDGISINGEGKREKEGDVSISYTMMMMLAASGGETSKV